MEGGFGGGRAQSGSNFNPSQISVFCLPLWFVLLVSYLRSHCLMYDKRMDPILLSKSFVILVLIFYSFRVDFCLCCEIDNLVSSWCLRLSSCLRTSVEKTASCPVVWRLQSC